MSTSFDNISKRMLGSITDEDINRLNPYQKTLSAAIATDKARMVAAPAMQKELVDKLNQVLDLMRERRDAEEEREWQADHAAYLAKQEQQRLLQLPAGKA